MIEFKGLKTSIQRRSHAFLRLMGIFGVLLGWATMYYFEDWSGPVFWLLISVSTILSATGAWGGLSEQWGYKPLSDDPLGWRAVKKSYKDAEPSKEETDEQG